MYTWADARVCIDMCSPLNGWRYKCVLLHFRLVLERQKHATYCLAVQNAITACGWSFMVVNFAETRSYTYALVQVLCFIP